MRVCFLLVLVPTPVSHASALLHVGHSRVMYAVLDAAAQALQANLIALEDEEARLLNEFQWRADFEYPSVRMISYLKT